MPIPLLSLLNANPSDGPASFYQVVNGSPFQIGNNFAFLILSAQTGVFVVGELITGGTSGATGYVTSIPTNPSQYGGTNAIVLNTVTGVFTAAETITGGTSGATGTVLYFYGVESTTYGNNLIATNRVILFNNNLYGIINGAVTLYNTSTSNWDVVYFVDSPSTPLSGSIYGGFQILTLDSTQYLCATYMSTNCIGIKSSNGSTWTEFSTGTGNTYRGPRGKTVNFNNVMYVAYYNSGGLGSVASINFLSESATVYTPDVNTEDVRFDLVVFKNQLLLISRNNTTSYMSLFRLNNSQFTTVLAFQDITTTSFISTSGGFAALFPDNDGFLYAIWFLYNNTVNDGWVVQKIQSSGGVLTNLGSTTSTVLGSLAYGTGNSVSPTAAFQTFVDEYTNPGGSLIINLAYKASAQASYNIYQWNGFSSALTDLSGTTTYDGNFTFADYKQGGGAYIFAQSKVAIINDTSEVSGGEILYYRTYGSGTASIKFYYTTTGESPSTSIATLTNTSTGSISGGNTITGVSIDNGATLQYVTWTSVADGVPQGTRVQIVAYAF